MRQILQVLGVYLVIAGVSGTIDHLAVQPVMGVVFNAFNRFLLPQLDALRGFEVAANLSLSVVGAVLLLATWQRKPRIA